jgi:hypothetical protein
VANKGADRANPWLSSFGFCCDGLSRGQLPRRFPAVESILACSKPSPFARRVEAGLGRRLSDAGRPDPAEESRRTTRGARQVRHESATTRFFAQAGSGPCRPVRFCPRAHGASAPEAVPLAGSETRNSEPTECAETAGSVRGAVVHAVCPCSLTVAEVGRRRRFGGSTFGCGWK